MKMKNIFRNILVGGMAATMLLSCDLNLVPTTEIVYEEGKPLFLKESDITAFQNGVLTSYRAVQYGVYTQSTEVMCDGFNATIGFGNNYGSVHRADYSFTAGDTYVESMWGNHYIAIKNYNIAIANAALVEDDATFKPQADILRGIALFCRASSYLTLARHFGNAYDPTTASTDLCVPLVLVYDQLEKPERATVQAVYDQIIEDLDEAEALLAAAHEAGLTVTIAGVRQSLAGSVRSMIPTVDAVKALKARYYLDVQDYDNAISCAEDVLASEAGYALASSGDAMVQEYVNDAGTEPIIQLYATPTEGAVGNTIFTLVNTGETVEKYFSSYYIPTAKLINAYNPTDLRFTNWFTNSLYPISASGNFYEGTYVFVKYLDNPALHSGEVETGAHAAKPLLISEMYLIAAEAYAMDGNKGAAETVLNALRAARLAGAVTGDIMEEVKLEWFRETVGEGHRLTCIKRWGEGIAARTPQTTAKEFVQTGPGYTERTFSADAHVFNWPVPAYEIKINQNLEQNPGYGVN